MGVKKYRSVHRMPDRSTFAALDPANLSRLFEAIALVEQIRPCRYDPGVRKFRTVDDAHRSRERREAAQHAERKPRGTAQPS